ncbi:MAG TPA: histidine kinase [Acidimicrobiales bacterium]
MDQVVHQAGNRSGPRPGTRVGGRSAARLGARVDGAVDRLVAAARLGARRAPPWAVDAAVAAAVAFPTAMDAWWNEEGTRQADGLTYALVAVSLAALLARRRWPLAVALVCGGALTGLYVLGHHGELLNLPVMVALYTVAVQGDRRRTLATALVSATWSGILGFTSDDPVGARGGSPVLETLVPLVPLALGEATRLRRELLARAEAERERETQRRVEAERVRIAQEFHDLVAHTMAAVNVHMGVAVAAFDAQPDKARGALAQARASSKDALQELRATVALLRDARPADAVAGPGPDGSPGPAAPAPRLAQVGDLAGPARAAGIAVTIEDGTAGLDLSPAVELAAYRIVQEALTNVVRHSGARHVAVSLRRAGDRLEVEVTDDGAGPPGPAGPAATTGGSAGSAHGYGLAGMAERAAAVGGHVDHGPGPAGG